LERRLGEDARFEVLGGAESNLSALELIAAEKPDLALLDIDLPPVGAVDTMLAARVQAPLARVVLMSRVENDVSALDAIRKGAAGFLVKDAHPEAVGEALAAVVRGEIGLSRALASRLLRQLLDRPSPPMGMRPALSPLTHREWEILDLLSLRLTTDEIAEHVDVTVETVRSHVKHILRKLGVHSRAEAVAEARRMRNSTQPGLD
jgi:two-component system nitrate/nitrite response regulator NarL